MQLNKFKLKELVKIKSGKDHKFLESGCIPVYGTGGVMRYVNDYLFEGESILLPRKGTLSNIQYVKGKFWTVDTIYYTEIKTDVVNPFFLFSYLSSLDLGRLNTGATIPSMTTSKYYSTDIFLPKIEIQNKIADVLLAYDVLINNNKKQIKLLEEAAQRLYKEWFVDLRFPGYEGEQIVDGVPKGWTRSILNTYCEIKSGYAFKSKNWSNFGLGVVKIKDISDCFINYFDCAKVSESTAQKAINYQLNKGDLVIAMTGATIGKIGISTKDNYYANQRVGKVFLGNSPIDKLPFAFCVLSQDSSFQYIVKHSSSSSAQPNISGEKIGNIPILYNESYVSRFNSMLAPAFKKIINLKEEIELCKESRDRLLPKLMNGEIEI